MRNRTSLVGCLLVAAVLVAGAGTLAGCGKSKDSAETVAAVDNAGADSLVASSSVASDSVAPDSLVSDSAGVSDSVPSSDAAVAGVPIVLTGNGVDGSKFGDSVEMVVAAMTAAHGPAADDSGWVDQSSPCEGLGTKEKRVQWASVVLVFSNGPTEFGPAGKEHFIAVYSEDALSPIPVNAPDGKPLLDETVGGLKKRYPNATVMQGEITGPAFQIKIDGDAEINGLVSGLTDADLVVSFNEGLICID